MKFLCRKCRNTIDLNTDRVQNKYLYLCSECGTPQKKADMVREDQSAREQIKAEQDFEKCCCGEVCDCGEDCQCH